MAVVAPAYRTSRFHSVRQIFADIIAGWPSGHIVIWHSGASAPWKRSQCSDELIPTDAARSCTGDVRRPGQAVLIGPFGRIDRFKITELSCTPDAEEVCVRPLPPPPVERVSPRRGSFILIEILKTLPEDVQPKGTPIALSYDHAATHHFAGVLSERVPLQATAATS